MAHLAGQLIAELCWIEAQAKTRQTCKRKAVGCSIVLVDSMSFLLPLERMVFAHNGPTYRQSQSRCNGERGNCGCPHAEPKAVVQFLEAGYHMAKQPHTRNIMLCTFSPCTNCANIIASSKAIDGLVFDVVTEHDRRGYDILQEIMPVVTRYELSQSPDDTLRHLFHAI